MILGRTALLSALNLLGLLVRRLGLSLPAILLGASFVVLPDNGESYAATVETIAPSQYEDAVKRFDDGDYQGAVVQLKNVLQGVPDHLPALVLIGRAYLELGDVFAAEDALLRAQAEGGDAELLIVPLAKMKLLRKRYKEIFTEAPTEGHSPAVEAKLQSIHGQAYLALRDNKRAETAFQRALVLRPSAVMPMVGLARIYLARLEIDKARKLVARATETEPENYLGWFVAAQVALRDNDPAAALESFDKSIDLEPEHIPSRMARAMVLINLGRFDNASRDLAVLRERIPEYPYTAFIDALIKRGLKDEPGYKIALVNTDVLLRNMELNALLRNPPLLYLAGVVSYARGNDNAARNFLSKHIQRDRFDISSRALLARLMLKREEPRDALAVLMRAVGLTPKSADLWRLIGLAHLQDGQHEEATKAFNRAISLQPDRTSVQTALALSLLQNDRSKEAVAGLEKALESDPKAVRPGIMLATILLRDREYDAALRIGRNMIARDPKNPALHRLMATAYLAVGDVPAARERLKRAVALDPNFLAAHRNLAQIDLQAGRVEAAKERIQSMTDIPGAGAEPLLDLAKIAVSEGKMRDAISMLKKARERAPNNVTVQLELIELFAQSGDGEAALRGARQLQNKLVDNLAAVEKLGKMELTFGDREAAAKAFQLLSKRLKGDPVQSLRVARFQIRADDLFGAHRTLKRGLVSDATNLGMMQEIVKLEARLGLFDDALLRTKILTKQFPRRAIGDLLRGDLLIRMQKFGDAAKAYATAIGKEPSGSLFVRQYDLLRSMGDERASLKPLEDWVAAHPKDYQSRNALAAAYMEIDETLKAIAAYEMMAIEQPGNPITMNNLAWLYFETGDERAVQTAEAAYQIAPNSSNILDTLGWILVETGQEKRGLKLLRNAHARASRRSSIRYHLAVALSRLGHKEEARAHLEAILLAKNSSALTAKAQELLDAL